MDKIYILDTTVILHSSTSVFNFPSQHVVIPIEVIEQVDCFKREMNELGKNARHFNRLIDAFRGMGSLTKGIHLDNGTLLQILVQSPGPVNLTDNPYLRTDSTLLKFGLGLREVNPGKEVVIVSKDLNLRVKADALGLKAEAYEVDRFDEVLSYEGYHTLMVTRKDVADFLQMGTFTAQPGPGQVLRPNEFVIFSTEEGKVDALGRVAGHALNVVVPLVHGGDEMAGIKPLNVEQTFVAEALLDDSIKLVTLQGAAGTGKTLLAVAAGLRQVLRDFTYNKVLIARPTIPMGRDIGFLPGDIKEKMQPWMQPIFDAVELIRTLDRRSRKPMLPPNILEMNEQLQIEPLTYIRGRSIPDQFLIIDEAQNLSPLEAKTIITRVGKNSKIILTGDVQQIDNPYMDAYSNGLAYVAGRFRDSRLSAHIMLRKGARSELAEAAVELL